MIKTQKVTSGVCMQWHRALPHGGSRSTGRGECICDALWEMIRSALFCQCLLTSEKEEGAQNFSDEAVADFEHGGGKEKNVFLRQPNLAKLLVIAINF